MKRIGIAVMALLLLIFCAVPCFAAEQQQNANVDERILQLEQKYGIEITYATDEDGRACIGTGALATLDYALDSVTPTVVKQVSNYYEKRTAAN